MNDFGKRSRLTPTRAGLEREVFFLCYSCSEELSEEQTKTHNCQEEASK